MTVADRVLHLHTFPLWSLWVLACVGLVLVVGAALWVSPPLGRQTRWSLLLAFALWLARVFFSRSQDLVLWATAVTCIPTAGLLLWLGPVPEGMPRRIGRMRLVKPQYRAYARRARVTSAILVVVIAAAIAVSVAFVDV